MRRLCALVVLIAMLILGSCGGDDSPTYVVDPELVGVWKATSFIVSNCDDEENNEANTNLVCTSFNCIQFTFEDDSDYLGMLIEEDFRTDTEGKWSAQNGQLTIRVTNVNPLKGSYSIDNDVLTYRYTLNGCDIELIMRKDP